MDIRDLDYIEHELLDTIVVKIHWQKVLEISTLC